MKTGMNIVAVALTVLLTGWTATEARAGGRAASVVVAKSVFNSAVSDASGDYWLAVGKANNLPDPSARRNALILARQDLTEAQGEAEEQYQARINVARDLGESRYSPAIDPANFVTPAEMAAHPNTFMPLIPGRTHVYRSVTDEGTEIVTVEVTHDTRVILGVTCAVIHDTATLNGTVIEDTRDWYAQDRQGNVWYFGEDTQEYERGKVSSIDGSWEAGEDGALPGIIMKGSPASGQVYRQEYALGEAEDLARVDGLAASVAVAYGSFNNCLQTYDFTPMDPGNAENKYFAPGVGEVLAVNVETGAREELIEIRTE